jgi:hypothetical protein
VALRSTDGKNWSVILETIDAKKPQTVSFEIKDGLSDAEVHIWETNTKRTFEQVATVKPVHGKFDYAFEPDSLYSLTTTTGQGKGTAQSPAQAAFPLPYSDDFESTSIGHAPKYLSDQDGAFEVRPCIGREGRCLEQVIAEIPVRWAALPDPFTIAGDSSWTDYTVAADVRFLSGAPAVLMGRIDSADVFIDGDARWPSGYLLRVKPNGSWELLSTEFKKHEVTLAGGTVKIKPEEWHQLELSFKGQQITVSLDQQTLGTVQNATHRHGMFALGTEWDHVQFDNLRIAR